MERMMDGYYHRFKMDIKQTAKQFRVLEKVFYWIPNAPDAYLIDYPCGER